MPHDARHVVDRAAEADRRGIGRLILPDAGRSTRDPWVTLGAVSAVTDAIQLGAITNPLTRRPEVTAVALQTLAELTGGRAFVILAVGGAVQLAGMGVPRPADIDTLAASAALVRATDAGEVWVATKGPRTIRALSGIADVILLSGVPFPLVSEVAAQTRQITGARVAFTLHHFFDATSRAASGERLVYEITNMRPEYAEAGGIDETLRAHVLTALHAEGPVAAGARIPDDVLVRFALGPDHPDPVGDSAALAATFGVDELVLPEASVFRPA
ncbi:LLM class flavin-dependent oxidoreductase [Microbacterium sp. NPDC016588]